MIRRNDDNILKKTMMMEVNGKQQRGRPELTWRRQVEESVKKVGLKIERGSWRSNEMEGRCDSDCGGDEVYPAAFGYEEKTGLKLDRRRKKKDVALRLSSSMSPSTILDMTSSHGVMTVPAILRFFCLAVLFG